MMDMCYGNAVRRVVTSVATPTLPIKKSGTFIPLETLVGPSAGITLYENDVLLSRGGLYQLSYTATIDCYGEAYVESCLFVQGEGVLPATKQLLMPDENITTMGNTTLANLTENAIVRLLVSASKDQKASIANAKSNTNIDGLNVTASITVLQLS
jgi:hypothetical protein